MWIITFFFVVFEKNRYISQVCIILFCVDYRYRRKEKKMLAWPFGQTAKQFGSVYFCQKPIDKQHRKQLATFKLWKIKSTLRGMPKQESTKDQSTFLLHQVLFSEPHK